MVLRRSRSEVEEAADEADALRDLLSALRLAVLGRLRTDPEPDDRLRGHRTTEAHAVALLERPPPGTPPPAVVVSRLDDVVERYALDELEREILLAAAAPELDRRVEQLYGYLNDEVARRHATVALLAELVGDVPLDAMRARLAAAGTLVRSRLVVLDDEGRPWAGRSVVVPERVALFLAGSDVVDDRLAGLLRRVVPVEHPDATRAAAVLRHGGGNGYLRSRTGAVPWAVAARAVHEVGLPALVVDLGRAQPDEDRAELLAASAREAVLQRAGLVVGPVDDVRGWPAAVLDAALEGPAPMLLVGTSAWEPERVAAPVLVLEVDPAAEPAARAALWRAELGDAVDEPTVAAIVDRLRMTSDQVVDAAHTARVLAAVDGTGVAASHVAAGIRSQNGARLENLSTRHPPGPSFDDAVFPPAVSRQLRELVARARLRDLVVDQWAAGGPARRPRATAALFAGASGTGKTLSAHIVAGELGLDLYTIDLSSIVDKYIGETEKNLERLFREAEGVNGVLFFDEADALLGKRSDVSDARDRYANLEVAYLLQRIERFDGVVVLATNLRSNLDDAYTRRFDAIIHFPEPDEAERLTLWRLHLASVPVDEDLDLQWLSGRFRLCGGAIRNAAAGAAYRAATDGTGIRMVHLVRSTAAELVKGGRLCTEDDFGPWFGVLDRDVASRS